MKTNKFLRAAAVLLILVVMTTCAISGTFAKYVTTDSSSDSARVANWGWDNSASITLDNLFLSAYNGTVNSDTDVIAPGTYNNASFQFTYDETNGSAPEVSYTFEVSTAGSTISDEIKNNTAIVWSLDGTEFVSTATATSWDQLLAAIEALDGNADGVATYAPQQMPDAFSTGDTLHTVGWSWTFEVDGAQNEIDTDMGNAADLAEVEIVISITATQID